jgi:hypothetical protein
MTTMGRTVWLLPTLLVGSLTSTAAVQISGRRLEDSGTFEYNDLSQYSVRFEKCQFIKSFDDEFAGDENNDSPLATKHFVVYKLCPSDACESCEKYGTYLTTVDDYLASTTDYQEQALETLCNNCDEQCNDNGEYCTGCGKVCYNYQNLENLGYVSASDYMECQNIDYADDDGLQLYVGPMCGTGGQKITIGLFSDENCWEPYTDLNVEDVIGAKLSYHLISHASSDADLVCLSCSELEQDDNKNENDELDYDDVNEMCENLYYASAKCESKTGLEGGFIQLNREDKDYENQVENEFMACTFIDAVLSNSYTESGEIDIYSKQDVVVRVTTPFQKLALSLSALSCVALFGTVVYMRHRIETQFPKASFLRKSTGQLA